MSAAICPKCSEEVLIPSAASRSATVQCPLCREEFRLAEVLDAMPPALIVVDDPEAAVSAKKAGGEKGFSFGDSGSAVAVPDFGIDSSGESASSATATARPRPGARPRRKKKSPVMEVVKVVAGGIVGLTIAQLVLWWVPGIKSHQRDPIGIAPAIGKVVPWVVPASFREGANEEPPLPNVENWTGQDGPDQNGNSSNGNSRKVANAQSGLPERSFINPNDRGNNGKKKPNANTQPAAAKQNGNDPGNADVTELSPKPNTSPKPGAAKAATAKPEAEVDPFADPEAVSPTVIDVSSDPGLELTIDDPLAVLNSSDTPATGTKPASKAKPEPKASAKQPAGQIRLKDAPRRSMAEVRAAINAATAAGRAWSVAESISKDLLQQTYSSFANLADTVALADRQESDISEQIAAAEDAAKSLFQMKNTAPLLNKAAGAWLQYPQRTTNGILMTGQIVSVAEQDEVKILHLKLNDQSEPVTVVCPPSVGFSPQQGESVIVLGTIIDDPKNRLIGYQGDATSIVWGGSLMPMPAASEN